MGIKSFVVDTSEEVIIYFTGDDAIDADHPECDLEAYMKTGDADHLRFLDGEVACEFVLRALTSREEEGVFKRALDSGEATQGNTIALCQEAYRAGCREIRNFHTPGDKVKPSEVPLSATVEREIGGHVLRVVGLGASKGDRVGKSRSPG